MAPLTPHWQQPSHPDIQEVVVVNAQEFTTKSISRVSLPPFSVFAKFDFPPCTPASEPTYATVQTGRDTHLNLNSDLLYINHSCEPTLLFDVGNLNILVGPKGLKAGDELTFFYPSTEWHMAQPFDCLCGTHSCRGRISGAQDMTQAQLDGMWLNGHIIQLRAEQGARHEDTTAKALQDAVIHAEKVLDSARLALRSYTNNAHMQNGTANFHSKHTNGTLGNSAGLAHRGPTSRELSGEMGGDTVCA
ncbi:histone-lysine n-methyltransferase ash1 [Fusarium longipes]|uniref:Histone-lysine n-methyltransferase ash1 n=1 Tax=Fusarium longipes TaxID=694270 RepID=A0A395SJZ6_9HYPO|nr:histone-lysine n-methyltransferase ash1 [Fusarium longipes]